MHKTDEQFLSDLYRGAKMGVETIDSVLDKVKNQEMKEELIKLIETMSPETLRLLYITALEFGK